MRDVNIAPVQGNTSGDIGPLALWPHTRVVMFLTKASIWYSGCSGKAPVASGVQELRTQIVTLGIPKLYVWGESGSP